MENLNRKPINMQSFSPIRQYEMHPKMNATVHGIVSFSLVVASSSSSFLFHLRSCGAEIEDGSTCRHACVFILCVQCTLRTHCHFAWNSIDLHYTDGSARQYMVEVDEGRKIEWTQDGIDVNAHQTDELNANRMWFAMFRLFCLRICMRNCVAIGRSTAEIQNCSDTIVVVRRFSSEWFSEFGAHFPSPLANINQFCIIYFSLFLLLYLISSSS